MSRGNKWNMRNRISSLWKPKHHLHLCLHDKDWVAHALVLVHYICMICMIIFEWLIVYCIERGMKYYPGPACSILEPHNKRNISIFINISSVPISNARFNWEFLLFLSFLALYCSIAVNIYDHFTFWKLHWNTML